MKLSRKTSPRLFQEECLAVYVYDRKRSGALVLGLSEVKNLLARLTFRNANWWGMKLRNVSSMRGDSPPSGNERNMVELRKAEQIRLAEPLRTVAESMGAFKVRPTRAEFASLFSETVPYETNADLIGQAVPGSPVQDNGTDDLERNFLRTLRQFSVEEQRAFLSDLSELLQALNVGFGDERVVFHAVPGVPRLGLTIGQAYCMQLGSDEGYKHGFALPAKGALPDVVYRREFKGANTRDYAYTNNHDRLREHWQDLVAFCRRELDRTDRSGHRGKHNPYFEKAIYELEYRAMVLDIVSKSGSPVVIMVNITWNSDDWKGPSDDPSNHKWVQAGNTPHESWNFDFDNTRNTPEKVYGYSQRTVEPKMGGANNLVIFHSQGKIVGFYGAAEVLREKVYVTEGQDYNIIGDRALSMVLSNKLEDIKAKGYLEDKQRMGQNGFIYLKDPGTALKMIDEAIALNPAQERQLQALRKWVETGMNAHMTSTNGTGKSMHPLNTILYGPPGTGKTYHAITHAVAIVDGEDVEVVKRRPREQVRKRYDELLDKRLVRTVTFHQSFSYEDFIEGIKPQTHVSKDGEEEVKLVTYEVQDGIFKLMCASARTGEQGAAGIIDEDRLAKANFYKVSLGQYNDPADDEIYAYCMANNVIAVGYGGSVDVSKATDEAGIKDILKGAGFKEDGEGFRYTVSVLRTMHLDMKVGDIVLVSAGNSMVRAIGRVSGGYFMDENAPIRFKEFLKVDWLVKDAEIPVEDLYPKNLSMGTLYSLDRNLVKKDYFRRSTGTPEKRHERYVLIIDEINRGNVASIFGELITLIEDDKRDGGKEPAKVKLPYSKKEDFSVPSNLYLLGTMNTADRSVEALDTALRRRFSFVEMPSLPEVIEPANVAGVDLYALLTRINQRVERLLDKDHHIGHSYFMGLKDLEDLKRTFRNKVIPLLEEYFHGDARKVGAVLGKDFVEEVKNNVPFAREFELDDYEVKTIYRLTDVNAITDAQPFIRIYANA
jgi:5-methylcytosine-specific restriction endonuclease McrBC GTP-binding regulatory subunit McrB